MEEEEEEAGNLLCIISFADTLFRMSDINMPHSCSKIANWDRNGYNRLNLITDIWPAWRQLILTCWQLVVPPAF